MAIHEECGVFGVMSTKRENVASIADEFEIPSFEMEEEVPVVEKTVEEVAEAVETQVQSEVEPIVIEHAEPIVAEADEFPSFSNMEIGFGGSTPMYETMASFLAGDTGFASPSFETEEKNDFYGKTVFCLLFAENMLKLSQKP